MTPERLRSEINRLMRSFEIYGCVEIEYNGLNYVCKIDHKEKEKWKQVAFVFNLEQKDKVIYLNIEQALLKLRKMS
jgi:hypothetical protein